MEECGCTDASLLVIVRRAMTYLFTGTAPPVDPAPKKWGSLRKLLVDYNIHRRPQFFASGCLQNLRLMDEVIPDETMLVDERTFFAKFMVEFAKKDAHGVAEVVEWAGEGEDTNKEEKHAIMRMSKRFIRMYSDEGFMVGLTQAASSCHLRHEWGWQMQSQAKDSLPLLPFLHPRIFNPPGLRIFGPLEAHL